MKTVIKGVKGKPLFKKRELQVIRLICKQYSTQEIADTLGVSKRTIDDRRIVILQKTKSKNSIGIYIYAIAHRFNKYPG